MKDVSAPNPCETHPHHVTRHWRGEDGAHLWSSNTVSCRHLNQSKRGAEGAWTGDITCVGERFQPKNPIMRGEVRGQDPSHWIATARSDREIDVHGLVNLKLEGGGNYAARVHEYIQFEEPCVKFDRLYWKLEILGGEYLPTHWWHKESAVILSQRTIRRRHKNWGLDKEKINFTWHLSGSASDLRDQYQGGEEGKVSGELGLSSVARALAWEGHAGLHFFTRFPEHVENPFVASLPEGFVVNRKWYGQNDDRWITTHNVR